MKFLVLPLLCLICHFAFSQPWLHRDTNNLPEQIQLFFVGDVMQHQPQIQSALDTATGDYDYKHCFRYIQPYWQKADYVIANLETTLSNRNFSGYPQFCAPWQLARDLKFSGVDILTTNNNHSCDKGAAGIRQTIYYLDSLQIPHTGTFIDTASWISGMPIYLRKGSFKIALISYTYGTNGIPVPKGQVVSLIDTLHMLRNIEKAKLDTATNIIAIMHWGDEYFTTPNASQRKLARFLHENGADIVIGSHPHVVQPIEFITDGSDTTGVTVFSLGNFISNQSKRYTNGGLGISLNLIRQKGKTSYRMAYLSSYVHRFSENGKKRYYVVPEPETGHFPELQELPAAKEFYADTDTIIRRIIPKLHP